MRSAEVPLGLSVAAPLPIGRTEWCLGATMDRPYNNIWFKNVEIIARLGSSFNLAKRLVDKFGNHIKLGWIEQPVSTEPKSMQHFEIARSAAYRLVECQNSQLQS